MKRSRVGREVDAVVHAVAGEHERGLVGVEDAVEPFVKTGTWKFPAGVPRFGKSGDRLAAETEVDDFRIGELRRAPQGGLDERRPAAAISDAVAKNRDPRRGGASVERKDEHHQDAQETAGFDGS